MRRYCLAAGLTLAAVMPAAFGDTVESALADYGTQGAGSFSAERGAEMWRREIQAGGEPRSCATCHGDDPGKPGRHARTGKVIEPMAPSVNSMRLTQRKEIEKWFLRNCKWAWGRECSAQEKGDFLSFLRVQ